MTPDTPRAQPEIESACTYGPLTDGLTIDHTCRNRSCVNVRRVADRDAAIREQTIRSVADMFDLRAQEALVVDTPIGSSAYNAMITARDLVLLMLTQEPARAADSSDEKGYSE